MKTSDTIGAISKAISDFQGEVTDAEKSKAGHGYDYADLGTLLHICRPLLAKNGLSFTQWPGGDESTVWVESCLSHESGEWMTSQIGIPVDIPTTKDGRPLITRAQAVGMVITYLRRYSLSAIMGIAQVDIDASSAINIAAEKLTESMDKTANYIIQMVAEGNLEAVAEAWHECSRTEKEVLWVAKTKGGYFTQQEKAFITQAASHKEAA